MRYLILVILLFGFAHTANAQHAVVIDKATGKILMSHRPTGKNSLEVLVADSLSCGLKLKDIEIKIISNGEYDQIYYDTVTLPNKDKENQKKENRRNKKNLMKQKLGFSEQEWRDLLEALDVRDVD